MSLIKLDRQGRASLKALAGGHELYEAERSGDGVITLVPVATSRVAVPLEREILSPDAALGNAVGEVADALRFNEEARSLGNYGIRVRTPVEIRALVWGDVA